MQGVAAERRAGVGKPKVMKNKNMYLFIGLEFSGETVRRWFEKEGARKVVRRIKPPLSESQKKRRIDFICDQVDEVICNFLPSCLLYTSDAADE